MKGSNRAYHWPKGVFYVLAVLLAGTFPVFAQDTFSNGKALNFPAKKYGISIGNSYEFTGIRFNLVDKNVRKVNGINITCLTKGHQDFYPKINGITLGITPVGSAMQPLNVGLINVIATKGNLNGLTFGGIFEGADHNNNGLSIGGLLILGSGNINGLALSGFMTAINGQESTVSGLAFAGGALYAKKAIKGIGITAGFINTDAFTGIAVAGFARTGQMKGLSVALYNRTDELHGVLFGLLNYAGNNSKGLRMLPFFNIHLKKS